MPVEVPALPPLHHPVGARGALSPPQEVPLGAKAMHSVAACMRHSHIREPPLWKTLNCDTTGGMEVNWDREGSTCPASLVPFCEGRTRGEGPLPHPLTPSHLESPTARPQKAPSLTAQAALRGSVISGCVRALQLSTERLALLIIC